MVTVADASVKVAADLSKFNAEIKGAGGQAQTLGKKFQTALNPTALFGGLAAGIAGSQIISFLGDATNAAAEFQDSVSATGVIFGEEAIPGLEEWADKASSAFGASKQDALAAANSMAVFGKSAGLVGDDLTEFSTELTQLGGDLASMFGGSTQEAIGAVGSALRGEFEPIRRYGVLLDDATLRQKAFEMGLIDTVKNALTPSQKVLAAQAAIMAQTSDAQGDFARTSEGMANTQRTLAAEMENVTIEIGEKLMPVMLDLANFVKDTGVPAISTLADSLDSVGQASEGMARFLDSITGAKWDIIRVQEELGVSYMEARDLIKQAQADGATSVEQAAERSIAAYRRDSGEHTARVAQMGADWEAYQQQITPVAEAIAAIPVDAIKARWADARNAAFQTVIEHAKGILDGQNQTKVAWEVLTQLQEEEQTRAQRISYLKGLLNSQELAAGLNDGRPGVSGAARALRSQIEAELAGLGVNGYNSGYQVGANVAAGIYASAHLADGATSYLAARISGYLPRSEPKEGPLRGITKVGKAIVRSITDGIYDNISLAAGASGALAGALSPAVGAPFAGGVATAAGMSGGRTYVINVNGVQRTVSTAEEAMRVLDELGAFSDGRLN